MNRASSIFSGLAARAGRDLREHALLYVGWAIWFIAFMLLVRATLGGPDGSRYMAYLRSLVFDHDLLLMNELEHFGQRIIVTSTGYAAQIANVGVIPFWLPFYLLAVLSAWLGGDVGSGMSSSYALWLDFGDWLYGLLAIGVMYAWARTRYPRAVALSATLLVALGTSFIYYVTALAPSYHTISALLSALFFFVWDRTRARRAPLQWLGLGLLGGLLMSMAQYHLLLLSAPALELAAQLRRDYSARGVMRALRDGTPLALGVALPLAPQFVAWWIIFGTPFTNPYALESNWSGANLLDVLFSSYHGLYFTAPLLLLATLGWMCQLRRDPLLFGSALLMLLGIAYSSSTRIAWWAGVSFGARYFIALTPLFVLGLAALVQWARARRLAALVWLLAAASALWTYGYFLQAFTFLTSFSEYHPPEQWLAGQWLLVRHLGETLAAHWLLPRAPALWANLAGFALLSLIAARLFAYWLSRAPAPTNRSWVVALALVPIAFAAYLFTTVAPGEAHRQQLAASGFYEQNRARDQFDFEQFSYEYVERARYHEAIGRPDEAQRDMQRAFTLWPVKARQLADERALQGYRPLSLKFGTQLELLGYQLLEVKPTVPIASMPCASDGAARCRLRVRLMWRAHGRLPADYDSAVLLLDSSGQVVARTPPARGLDPFPTSWWPAEQLISDEHELEADGIAAPSLLKVRVELFDANARKRLAIQDVAGRPHDGVIAELKRPPSTRSTEPPLATLGQRIALLGYGLERAGDALSLTLRWRAETNIAQDYTVFAHLRDAQGQLIAQSDAQPLAGRYPTHAWSTGEVVSDVHRFTLSAAALARADHFAVGLYTLADGARLPSSLGGDAIQLKVQGVTP